MSEAHRFGVVALVGAPNVGKSTLINTLIGEKISIMSRRPQTTRHRILGIKTLPDAQLVFVDTPGLHRDQHKGLNRVINRTALSSVADADVVAFMIDHRGWRDDSEAMLRRAVGGSEAPVVLIINKIDRLNVREKLLPLIKQSAQIFSFADIVPLCARKKNAGDELLPVLIKKLPEGAAGFPTEQRTDKSARFFAAELVREQTYKLLGNELPYQSAVEVSEFVSADDEEDDPRLQISAVIWVAKASQKKIIIGRGGQLLKTIGERARKQMQKTFDARVRLDLHVKVRANWSDNAEMLRALGYAEEQ